MLSPKHRLTVTSILSDILGYGTSLKNNEVVYYCPFCHHHKKKLNVNLESQKFHCWVCNAKGVTIKSLLRRLDVDYSKIQKISKIYNDDTTVSKDTEVKDVKLYLPKEFKPLRIKPQSINPIYNNAIAYLKKRNILYSDIVRYNIGYCESGIYANRIIIPSYSDSGELNYFIARTFYDDVPLKYKYPPINRDVIIFENQINWSEPIVLVEGVYDALSVKRNAIPLLGKTILSTLRAKIFDKKVKEVIILLDSDAVKESSKHTEFFIKNGIKVRNIIPTTNDDAGDMGFRKVNELIRNADNSDWGSLILDKLKTI